MKRYVSTLAISPNLQDVVLLKKDRGPAHVIGKLTMPGGQVEEGDPSLAAAAARELKEECGVQVEPHELIQIFRRVSDFGEWTVFFAIAPISGAKSQPGESEEISLGSFQALRRGVENNDPAFTSDFAQVLLWLDTSSDARRMQVVSLLESVAGADEAPAYEAHYGHYSHYADEGVDLQGEQAASQAFGLLKIVEADEPQSGRLVDALALMLKNGQLSATADELSLRVRKSLTLAPGRA